MPDHLHHRGGGGPRPSKSGNGTPYLYHPSVVVSWGCSCAAPGTDTSSKTAKDLRLLNPARPSF